MVIAVTIDEQSRSRRRWHRAHRPAPRIGLCWVHQIGQAPDRGAPARRGTYVVPSPRQDRRDTHMSAAHNRIAARPMDWCDNAAWQEQIDQAIATPDPILANLRITIAHHQLSLALQQTLGPDSGANFHTWATWGS